MQSEQLLEIVGMDNNKPMLIYKTNAEGYV